MALLPEDITRINVAAHFVLSLGAKVNNNKWRIVIVYTELEDGISGFIAWKIFTCLCKSSTERQAEKAPLDFILVKQTYPWGWLFTV